VSDLAFSGDGKTLFSASADQTVKIWSTETWRESSASLQGQGDEVWAVAVAADGGKLTTGGKNGLLMMWNTRDRRPPGERTSLPENVSTARALPGGNILLRTIQRHFSVLDPATMLETTLPVPKDKPVWFVLPNFLAVQEGTERFQLYEFTANGLVVTATLPIAPSPPISVAFSPAARLLAWRRNSTTINVTNIEAQGRSFELADEEASQPVRFSADGGYLLAISSTNVARVWDLAQKRRLPLAESYLSPLDLPLTKSLPPRTPFREFFREHSLAVWLSHAVAWGKGNSK
jgi:WD40 repeat protein